VLRAADFELLGGTDRDGLGATPSQPTEHPDDGLRVGVAVGAEPPVSAQVLASAMGRQEPTSARTRKLQGNN